VKASADISVYNEYNIGRALARHTFKGMLCVVDNCYWPGSECDLLVVTNTLRVVDVEIKISRADLKADRAKDKWHQPAQTVWDAEKKHYVRAEGKPLEWPRGVWKHYYAIAAPIWKDELLEHCGAKSGVLCVHLSDRGDLHHITVKRKCKSNPDYKPLEHHQVIDIARLASLRLWDAYQQRDAAIRKTKLRIEGMLDPNAPLVDLKTLEAVMANAGAA